MTIPITIVPLLLWHALRTWVSHSTTVPANALCNCLLRCRLRWFDSMETLYLFFSYKRKTFLFQPVCVCVCVTVCLCVCASASCRRFHLACLLAFFGISGVMSWYAHADADAADDADVAASRSLALCCWIFYLLLVSRFFTLTQTSAHTERERERECDSREVFGDKISSLAEFALCLQIILDFTISFSPCLSIYFSPSLSLPVYLLLFLCLLCLFFNSNPLAKTITRYKVNNNNNNNTSHNINNNNTNNVRVRHCNAQWGKCRTNLSANRQILSECIY